MSVLRHRFAFLFLPGLLILLWVTGTGRLLANVPGGGNGTGANVTLTDNGTTVTLANGLVSIVITKASASIATINYTYNNGSSTVTNPMLRGGTDGGQLYWSGNPDWLGTESYTESVVANSGSYAEIDLLSTSATNGIQDIHYSMLQGSPGFYSTCILTHRNGDIPNYIQVRPNIYAGTEFNWMSVDAARNKLMAVSATNGTIAVPTGPKETYLWTSGPYNGRYEDKYKYTTDMGLEHVWGWSSVSLAGNSGSNAGIWIVSPSSEQFPGGPMERSLMEHIGTTMLTTYTGGYYGLSPDGTILANEPWTKTYGPYFVYCNSIALSNTNPYQVSQTLYSDAKAQAVAEEGAWPYSWFNNTSFVNASGRGSVSGQIVISDTGNPNASAANLWVGVAQQPNPAYDIIYDFQEWIRNYQFWVQTDANGNFTIPNVIAGSNYTLYAFGRGAAGTFISQAQTTGSSTPAYPPLLYNLPSSPFSVTVTGGSNTNLGPVSWKPTRVGPTVFEIGYPDRTSSKFRHGDDYWVGDIGPSASSPSSVWSKWLEYPNDFPNGPNYTVGSSRWSTDWNFIQPVVLSTAGNWNTSTSTINFTIPAGTSLTGSASLYLGFCSDYYSAIIVTLNGTNAASISGLVGSPTTSVPSTGFYAEYGSSDSNIREGNNGAFFDQRLTFPAKALRTGTNPNIISLSFREVAANYFADHFMYDYIRLELAGYVPPAPPSIIAYPGNNSALVAWPVVPGATSYNILRSTTSGANFSVIGSSGTAPMSGSGFQNGTYLDTSATNNTPYFYEIQASNTTGTSVASAQSAAVTPVSSAATTVPSAPALTATTASGAVTLTWPASAGANYYTIQRSTLYDNGGGAFNTLSTITLTNTTTGTGYTDATPTNGSTYAYTILASNAAGTSGTSGAVNAVPLAAAPVTAPNLSAIGSGTTVTLNWTAVSGATGYVVQSATSLAGPYTFAASVSYLTYPFTGLTANTTYYYKVSANNSGGVSAASTLAVTTPLAPPSSLTIVPGNTQLTIKWPAVAGATSYIVGRSIVTGGPYATVGTPTGPSFTHTGLTNGTTYYYVVASVNSNGTGANSTEANGIPITTVPVAPLSVTATAGIKLVGLNWSASAGGTSYTVLGGTSNGGVYSTIASGLVTTSSTVTGLIAGTTYYYVITASNAGGSSAYSAQVSATPTAPPPNLVWTGSASTAWDTTSVNWQNSGTAATYADSDGITFNDSAAGSTVAITSTVSPGSITFNNSSLNYTVNGGPIAGSAALTKQGTATVTFNDANTYSGGTTVTGGTLALGVTGTTGGAAGSGAIVLNQGATLAMTDPGGHDSLANPIQIASGASATLSSASLINSFSGSVSGPSNSVLTLSGPVSFGVSGSAQFVAFSGLVIVPAGSQLRFSSASGPNDNGGSNANFLINGSVSTQNFAGEGGMVLGSLSGNGSITGQSNTPAGNDIYFVGSNNTDSTFSGGISDGAIGTTALTKVGAGTLILAGANTYSGATRVNAGVLEIMGTVAGTSALTTSTSATLYLAGGSLSISGPVTNNGTFKISGATSLNFTGGFTNNGILDLINGSGGLPANILNNGTILDSSAVKVQQATMTSGTFGLTINGYAEHTYQLQSTASLSPVNWQNVGAAQTGSNTILTFTNSSSASGSSGFYRILVSP